MSIIIKQDSNTDDTDLQAGNPKQRLQLTAADAAVTLGNNADEGGLDLGRVVGMLRRRLWLVLAIDLVVLVATLGWNRTRPPAYDGSFKILVEPVTAESQVVSALKGDRTSVESQDLGNAQSSKTTLDYPTQIQLLLSDKLLLPVVGQLQPAYPKITYELLKESLNISRFKEQTETKILEVRYRSASEAQTKQVMDLVSSTYIKYSLSERQTNVRRAVQFVDAQLPKVKAQVRDLELALQTFREQHQLIDPTTMGSQLGDRMSNTQQEQLTTQVELAKAKQLYRSLAQQIQLQPKGAEAASVLSDAPGYQQLVKQLQELDVELQTLSAELTDEHPKIIALREKRRKLLPLIQQKANDALGTNLSGSISNAQSLPYQNPLRQDLNKQFLAAQTQVQVLEAKLTELNGASQNLAGQTGELPIVTRQYENLQRQLKIATEQLSKFLQKREELTIDAARQEVPWELIAPPAVKKVSSSSLVTDLVLGSVVGLLLGVGTVLLLEKMNDVIYSLKDLCEEVNLPILGMIPNRDDEYQSLDRSKNIQYDKTVSSLTHEHSEEYHIYGHNCYLFSPFIEAFRALNSQIRLLSPDAPIRSLVIGSSLPDEGKTTIAIQLAQAAAAMGQRVLLVNTDLRKPSLQNLVNQQHNTLINGLTDIIAGKAELMDTVQLLPGEENLYVLLSGSIALDPTSILSSKKMQSLMRNCRRNFDLVIYDTVPLNFADSLLLIPQTDGLLMVTRLAKINRDVLRNSLRTLEVSKVAVLGLVVNMTSESQSAGTHHSRQAVNV
jgi:polysaccharide biosynthesis transport protein